MSTFWDLLQQSVIMQAVLTLAVWGSILALYIQGRTIPEQLLSAGMLILGFFFGAKTQRANLNALNARTRLDDLLAAQKEVKSDGKPDDR